MKLYFCVSTADDQPVRLLFFEEIVQTHEEDLDENSSQTRSVDDSYIETKVKSLATENGWTNGYVYKKHYGTDDDCYIYMRFTGDKS